MIETIFLSMEEDSPLGIWWADQYGCGVVDMDKFIKESLIDLSPKQAERYINKFGEFIEKLEELKKEQDQ